jgi:hypothetical protein
MPTCIKCQKEFPNWMKIDGCMKNLSARKFCLECSPFGKHNTRDITKYIETSTTRICLHCHQEKNKNEFGYRKQRKGKTYSICKACTTMLKIKEQKFNKKKCMEYKGNKCVICGYDRCMNAMQFHHLDPSEKEFTVGKRHSMVFEKVIRELDKCILVCSNCHNEIHAGMHQDKIEEIKFAGFAFNS